AAAAFGRRRGGDSGAAVLRRGGERERVTLAAERLRRAVPGVGERWRPPRARLGCYPFVARGDRAEGVDERLRRGEPFVRGAGERLLEERVEGGVVDAVGGEGRRLVGAYLREHVAEGRAFVRVAAGDELEGDDRDRPEVAAVVDRRRPHLLGAHVH